MFSVVFCIASSVVYNLNVSFSRLITSVGGEREQVFLLSITRICVVSSSSSGCLGKALLFHMTLPVPFT